MDREVEQRKGMALQMIGKEGINEGYEIESGECYGDTHLDLRM